MEINVRIYRSTTKKEYAKKLDISVRTLRYWLNVRYYSELKEFGYDKLQKKLTSKQVFFLDRKLTYTDYEQAKSRFILHYNPKFAHKRQ